MAAAAEVEEPIEGEIVEERPSTEDDGHETIPPSQEVVEYQTGQGLLTIDPTQRRWTDEQRVALRAIGVETQGELAVPAPYVAQFLHTCQAAGLDPWRKEAYLITYGKRWVDHSGAVVDRRRFTLVTGIDGFRNRGEQTGQYRGQVGPQWMGEDGAWKDFWNPKWGTPIAARVGIMREGFDVPVYGVVAYDEMVALVDEYAGEGRNRKKTGNKVPTESWERMPSLMLAKCAEAQGFRKAFPRTFAGIYEHAEMAHEAARYEESEERLQAARDNRRRSYEDTVSRIQAAHSATVEGDVVETRTDSSPTEEPVSFADAVDGARDMLSRQREEEEQARLDEQTSMPEETRRAFLNEEVAEQARIMGVAPVALYARHAAARGKAMPEFTVEELQAAVAATRKMVVKRLRDEGCSMEAGCYEEVEASQALPTDMLFGIPASEPAEG